MWCRHQGATGSPAPHHLCSKTVLTYHLWATVTVCWLIRKLMSSEKPGKSDVPSKINTTSNWAGIITRKGRKGKNIGPFTLHFWTTSQVSKTSTCDWSWTNRTDEIGKSLKTMHLLKIGCLKMSLFLVSCRWRVGLGVTNYLDIQQDHMSNITGDKTHSPIFWAIPVSLNPLTTHFSPLTLRLVDAPHPLPTASF